MWRPPRVVHGPALERWAAGLSVAAGGVHGLAAPDHFAEWWGYGAFFVVAALAQVVFGLALFVGLLDRPLTVGERRALYAAGVVGNVLIVALYVVTRTVGIPFFGPEAGEVEDVAAIDAVSKALEVLLVLVLLRLLVATRTRPSSRSNPLS